MKNQMQFILRLIIIFMLIFSNGCSSSSNDNTVNDNTDVITAEEGDTDSSSGDGTSDENNNNSSYDEESVSGYFIPDKFLAVYTDSNKIPAFAVLEDGEILAPITEKSESDELLEIVGSTLLFPDGQRVCVYLGEDGLPEKAVTDDLVIIFSNYSKNTVDATIHESNGSVTEIQKVSVDPDAISLLLSENNKLLSGNNKLRKSYLLSNQPQIMLPDQNTLNDLAALLLCADASMKIFIAVAIGVSGGIVPLAIYNLSLIASHYIQDYANSMIDEAAQSLGADPRLTSFFKGLVGCASGPFACASIVTKNLENVVNVLSKIIQEFIEGTLWANTIAFWSSGDPHLCTIDGLHYDFQAVGEFVYLESTADPIEMTVQVRQEPYYNSQYVAMNTAVAMSVVGDIIEIYTDLTKYQTPIYINGEPINSSSIADTLNLPNSGQVNFKNNQYTVIWPDYSKIQIINKATHLDISGSIPETRKNTLHGIAGNFDEDHANDFMLRDGSVTLDIDAGITKEKLYNEFGKSWRVTQDESLFTYAEGEDTSTYTDLNFPYEIVTVDDLPENEYLIAEQTCRDAGITAPILLQDCILDVGFTNDPAFAEEKGNLKSPNQSLTVTDSWLLYWDAQKNENSDVITVTPDETWKTGMALRESSLNLNNDFEKSFEVYMGDNDNGADGMVFLLLSEAPSKDVSIDGGGYLGFDTACNGKQCIGIEIDTYRNSSDPAEDHIALIRNGSVNHNSSENENFPLVPLSSDIEDGTTHSVTIGWKQKTKTLSVAFDGSTIMTQENFDIINMLGTPVATYGFSGATGSATNEQYFIPALDF